MTSRALVEPEYFLALSQSIRAHQFGEPGLLSAPNKVTNLYRKPSMSTSEKSANPREAKLGFTLLWSHRGLARNCRLCVKCFQVCAKTIWASGKLKPVCDRVSWGALSRIARRLHFTKSKPQTPELIPRIPKPKRSFTWLVGCYRACLHWMMAALDFFFHCKPQAPH